MSIPQDFIQLIIDRNSLEDVVSSYVPLKRSGSTAKGICPFHREKTPSFSVSVDKQLYYCFGCSAGGTVINFIMQIEGLDFIEAVKFLAERAGLEMPQEDVYYAGTSREERQVCYEINKMAAMFFHARLYEPRFAAALEYIKKRGLDDKTIKHFALGYAPDSTELVSFLFENGFDERQLLKAGITAKTDSGRVYDRFRNRIMFPIVDQRKNVIGFGGRAMGDGNPKYLNSAETPVFNKSANLFGLNFANKTSARYLILVEGYMDVISLHQHGITAAVATLGTALTVEQAKIVRRVKNEVVIAYDSDEAGQAATRRAIEILMDAGLKVRVAMMRECKDPDEFVQKFGVGAFKKLIADAPVQMEYKIDKIKKNYDLNTTDGRVSYVKEVAVELAKLAGNVEREVYAARVADDAGISMSAVFSEVDRVLAVTKRKSFAPPPRAQYKPKQNAESLLLSLMYNHEGVVGKVFSQLSAEDFSEGGFRKLAEVLRDGEDPRILLQQPDVDIAKILFEQSVADDVETAARELVDEMLKRRNQKLIDAAVEKGDVEMLNRLLSINN